MKHIYLFLTLLPAPLFLLGFVVSISNGSSICGMWHWEMPIMWFIMFLAHLTPWLLWWQQRNFTRN